MGAIVPFLNDAVFEPGDIQAMSMALEDVCKELKIDHDGSAIEIIATRIIELARRGERSPTKLRDRLLAEANGRTDAVRR
jgi:hypothetical protein